MEARVIDASVDVLASGEPRLMNFDLVDPASGDPGVCGGTITLLGQTFKRLGIG